MRELQILVDLGHHPYIVRLYEVHRVAGACHLVFECMEEALDQAILRARAAPHRHLPHTTTLLHQLLQAVAYVHDKGWMHRDIKPSNILLQGPRAKLADFSLARKLRTGSRLRTTYVSTRWYRAPEIMLEQQYGASVDVWAYACVVVETNRLKPIFAGENEADQWRCILSYLSAGSLTQSVQEHFAKQGSRLDTPVTRSLRDFLGDPAPDLMDLADKLLRVDPQERLTAHQALQHPYFGGQTTLMSPVRGNVITPHPSSQQPQEESPVSVVSNPYTVKANAMGTSPASTISNPYAKKKQIRQARLTFTRVQH